MKIYTYEIGGSKVLRIDMPIISIGIWIKGRRPLYRFKKKDGAWTIDIWRFTLGRR